jgi:hypothetical protein
MLGKSKKTIYLLVLKKNSLKVKDIPVLETIVCSW